MDLSKSIEPRSDQQNFEDYLAGPKTVTISGVTQGNAEQPVNIELEEYPGRPFKPSKTVRRILVSAWGADSSVYIGRRMTLFGDPTVKWAGETVGGIRVSHLSDIDKPLTIALSVSRGKRQKTTIQPLPAPARDWDALIAGCTTEEELRALYTQANDPAVQKRILAARETLNTKDDNA